jgi:hypothetical protein
LELGGAEKVSFKKDPEDVFSVTTSSNTVLISIDPKMQKQ